MDDLSVGRCVGSSSALWKNGGSDPDAVWHHRSDGSKNLLEHRNTMDLIYIRYAALPYSAGTVIIICVFVFDFSCVCFLCFMFVSYCYQLSVE